MAVRDQVNPDAETLWTIAEAEDDGKPLIFRIRNGKPAGVATEKYRNLIAVSWPYEPGNDSGMPAQDQVAQMGLFEDLLMPALEGPRQAFLTVVVTGNGVREWQWYSRDAGETMALVNKALSNHEPFPVEFSVQDDPKWQGYFRFQDILEP
jgi:hypothetical protein